MIAVIVVATIAWVAVSVWVALLIGRAIDVAEQRSTTAAKTPAVDENSALAGVGGTRTPLPRISTDWTNE